MPDTAVVKCRTSPSQCQQGQDCTLDKTMYAHTRKRMHLGSGGGVIRRGSIIPLRAVRDRSINDQPVAAILPRRSSWLSKIVPAVIAPPRSTRWLFGHLESIAPVESEDEEQTPLLGGSRALRARASDWKPADTGIEHHPVPAQPLRRCHSFAGYVYSQHDEDELDDNMPEVREALRITATLHANGYRYEHLDGGQRRHLEDFVDEEITESL
ncbi:hypothetical protein C8F04DRAFT_1139677 [Mycena alexandri]|uniref:Uncharacterized protein n=1 Tax=Mycena alexandri TaxID=1745969 RepID=A0AAD6S7K2_9AGAR|nr:hypothetical protein C8F04DRAFT_1139677 [Mycena alexandri]